MPTMQRRNKTTGQFEIDPLSEVTRLSPNDERTYQKWIRHYKLKDIDPATGEPYDDVRYDIRGYWKANYVPGMAGFGPPQFDGAHGPDTWKQHGHPTFSQESMYSRGPWDGGLWVPTPPGQPDV